MQGFTCICQAQDHEGEMCTRAVRDAMASEGMNEKRCRACRQGCCCCRRDEASHIVYGGAQTRTHIKVIHVSAQGAYERFNRTGGKRSQCTHRSERFRV